MRTNMSVYGSVIEEVVADHISLEKGIRRLERAGDFDELYELLALWSGLLALEGVADDELIQKRHALHKVTAREERVLNEMIRARTVDPWIDYFRNQEFLQPGRQRRMANRLRDQGASADLLLYAAATPGVIPEIREWIEAGDITSDDIDRLAERDKANAGLWQTLKARVAWVQGHKRKAKALLREALVAPLSAESWILADTQAVFDGEPGYLL